MDEFARTVYVLAAVLMIWKVYTSTPDVLPSDGAFALLHNGETEEPSILAQPGVVSAVRMFLTLFVIAHMLACVRVAGGTDHHRP